MSDQSGGHPHSPPFDGPQRLAPIVGRLSPTRERRPSSATLPHSLASATPPQSPHHPPQVLRRQTIADETSSVLLTVTPSAQAHVATILANRRRSFPAFPPVYRHRNSHVTREHLRAWGHLHFGNGSSADCFVVPVAFRRHSVSPPEGKGDDRRERRVSFANPNRATIRARIRPRSSRRKPFVLQRTFDLDELRTTIPEPSSAGVGRRFSTDPSPTESTASRRRQSCIGLGTNPRSHPSSEGSGNHDVPSNALPMRKFSLLLSVLLPTR